MSDRVAPGGTGPWTGRSSKVSATLPKAGTGDGAGGRTAWLREEGSKGGEGRRGPAGPGGGGGGGPAGPRGGGGGAGGPPPLPGCSGRRSAGTSASSAPACVRRHAGGTRR